MKLTDKDFALFVRQYGLTCKETISFIFVMEQIEEGKEKESIINYFMEKIGRWYDVHSIEMEVCRLYYTNIYHYCILCINEKNKRQSLALVMQESMARRGKCS